ncbi:major facilitator superfamily domain-containing protein [Scheffersomyces amazonensis]|uniref:major facilitator superfamily domain-containing protein n=1 Tax=Scheffersomyces amazonensis TaxID=1078765 RepID=UPI00315DA963
MTAAHSLHSIVTSKSEIKDHNKHIVKPPVFTTKSIANYFLSRPTTLFPSREELSQYEWSDVYNPFKSLREVSLRQWNFFFIGFWAWTWDALDYFTISLNVSNIAADLNVTVKDVSWGLTLVLMFRSVGAVLFGLVGDTKGRKWPYIINLLLLSVIQIGTGFITTYKEFLAVRSLFGIAMGGLYGICAAEALSDAPRNARGIMSGIFQEGYAFGYLLAVVFQRAIVDTTGKWQNIMFFSAGVSVIFIVWRFFTPETDSFIKQQERISQEAESDRKTKMKELKSQARKAFKQYWLISIYCVLMMAGFNFSSHGSQDLYPTMLTKQFNFSADRSTVANVCANLGALVGGIFFGHMSTFIGRRFGIICACVLTGVMIYPWGFKPNAGTVFVFQMGVQGAWGIAPIHLSELSPPQFRTLVVGTSYQLGNLVSSASSTIEATIGERFPIAGAGKGVYNYGKTMAIFMAAVTLYLMLIVFLGPENRGADLGIERDDYYDEEGLDDLDDDLERKKTSDNDDYSLENTKANAKHEEVVNVEQKV